VLNCWIA